MDGNALLKGMNNLQNRVKRTAARAQVDFRKAVGLESAEVPDLHPQYESQAEGFRSTTEDLETLKNDALNSLQAMQRASSTAYSLATHERDSLLTPTSKPPFIAADALVNVHANIIDTVLPRVEKRIRRGVIDPVMDELARSKEIITHMNLRKRCLTDATRYRLRASEPSATPEDSRKAQEKLTELDERSSELLSAFEAATRRRAPLLDRVIGETVEYQRRYYIDSARALDGVIDAIGSQQLVGMRASGDELPDPRPSVDDPSFSRPPQQRPPRSSAATSSGSDLFWNELDDEFEEGGRPPPRKPSVFDDPDLAVDDGLAFSQPDAIPRFSRDARDSRSSYPSGGVGQRESLSGYQSSGPSKRDGSGGYPKGGVGSRESTYPSSGVGQRESVGAYPTTGVGQKEALSASSSHPSDAASAYPSGGSRQRESAYPSSRSRTATKPPPGAASTPFVSSSSRDSEPGRTPQRPSRRTETEGDLLGFDSTTSASQPHRSSSRPKRNTPPITSSTTTGDLLDLDGGATTTAATGGGFARSSSAAAMEGDLLGDFGFPRKSPANPKPGRPPVASSSSAPTMRTSTSAATGLNSASGPSSATNDMNEALHREQLRRKHEAEIKARADEKLAVVRERERAESKEREQKDTARASAERKIDQWTGNGARRGNLRALLASLDTVLYPGATWKPVSMDVMKENSKVKVNYHKAILQVHPDKISSKNLAPEHLVLAELVFDELQNGHEVWTAEQEGKPPPPGSVGPKGGMGRGMGNMGGMGGMGRGNMGMGGPSFGMNRQPMGRGMGGMGMGGMPGMAGRGGMGMGGMGMGGMGRGVSGMGNIGNMGSGPAMNRRSGTGNIPPGAQRRQ